MSQSDKLFICHIFIIYQKTSNNICHQYNRVKEFVIWNNDSYGVGANNGSPLAWEKKAEKGPIPQNDFLGEKGP